MLHLFALQTVQIAITSEIVVPSAMLPSSHADAAVLDVPAARAMVELNEAVKVAHFTRSYGGHAMPDGG